MRGVRNEDRVRALPSQDELCRVLHYFPDSGLLLWKERPRSDFASERSWKVWNARYSGKPALHCLNKDGYRHGNVFGVAARAHRVIWKMMTGEEACIIDHDNRSRSDNRWANLKNGSDAQNMLNKSAYSNNRSGITGVYWHNQSQKWRSVKTVNGKKVHLGDFSSLEDAKNSRKHWQTDNPIADSGRKVI